MNGSQKREPGWKTFSAVLAVIASVFVASLVLPLAIGIWLPDIAFAPKQTLAEKRLQNGHSFRVVQYWNEPDFNYNTELWHTLPNGQVIMTVLDYDDNKSWSVPMVVNEASESVEVTLGGGRVRRVSWEGVLRYSPKGGSRR